MSSALSRIRDWWNRSPGPENFAPAPPDATLTAKMAELAEQRAAGDVRLDFSVDSLTAIETETGPPDLAAAYLGEVLRRDSGDRLRWSSAPGTPGLALGTWMVELDELIAQVTRDVHPRQPLTESARELLTFVENPTAETSERLGWRTVAEGTTAWDDLTQRWRAFRNRADTEGS